MKIEVVGPGCARCKETLKNVSDAVKESGIQTEICYVTDVAEFAKKGVMFTPAVIIDGQVKISGKIPTVDEIKKFWSPKESEGQPNFFYFFP